MKLLPPVTLFCLALTSAAAQCVPFQNDPSYVRCFPNEPLQWWEFNTGAPSYLYHNGQLAGVESGTWSLNLPQCWQIESNAAAIKVQLIDSAGAHAENCAALIRRCAPGVQVTQQYVSRFYPQDIVTAFNAAVDQGAQVVCLPAQVVNLGDPPNDAGFSNALWNAQLRNGGVILSVAVPNENRCLCTQPERPESWAYTLPNLMPATALYADGTRISNPGAAYGFHVLGWPGRNIILASGYYSSGTSYAAAIQAGVVALMLAQVHRTFVVNDQVPIALRDSASFMGGAFNTPIANPLTAMMAWDGINYHFEPRTEP